ncbi:MAG: hypothetical protein GKS00_24665 [Alphaproteobacteria bacterium]|nr:hypothetical protein [Alphaproteobacteria bacterium]
MTSLNFQDVTRGGSVLAISLSMLALTAGCQTFSFPESPGIGLAQAEQVRRAQFESYESCTKDAKVLASVANGPLAATKHRRVAALYEHCEGEIDRVNPAIAQDRRFRNLLRAARHQVLGGDVRAGAVDFGAARELCPNCEIYVGPNEISLVDKMAYITGAGSDPGLMNLDSISLMEFRRVERNKRNR